MKTKSCFFIGHREADEALFPALEAEVRRHIVELGETEFIVGHYGGFDYLSRKAVLAAKREYPELCLRLLLPYHPGERPVKTPEGVDCTYYPPGMERVPRRAAIVRANRYMVDHVDFLIAYVWHTASHARELLEYAQRREERGLIQITVLPRIKHDVERCW